MLRRCMSSILPNSLTLLRQEQMKPNSYSNPGGSEDNMQSLTRALLAVKKVDKKLPAIQQSFLIGSLLEQLCSLYEPDKIKSKKLYYALCEQLAEWNIISPVAYMEEFSSVQTQYRNALFSIIRSSLLTLDIDASRLPSMLDLRGETSKPVEPVVVDRSKVFNFETSRYNHEFTELGKLGSGGYGSVYRARSKMDGQEYAIKKIPLPGAMLSERNDMLMREVRVLASLRHKNVVQYHSAWVEHESDSPNMDDDEVSNFDSDGVIPFSTKRGLRHTDSYLLQSSDEEISQFDSIASGAFGAYSNSSVSNFGTGSAVVSLNNKKIDSSPLSKFWGESSASETSSRKEIQPGKIKFTISPAASENEIGFEDSSPVDFKENVVPASTPPKEVIFTHGVRREMRLNRVKSFIYSTSNSKLSNIIKSSRNRSCNSMIDKESKDVSESWKFASLKESSELSKPTVTGKLVLYMQMQLCQMSLKHWLSVRNRSISSGKKFFHDSISFHIMKQIADALHFIHSKDLIHRDVKPPNIFLNNEENPHILLGDFGLAKNSLGRPNSSYVPLKRGGVHLSRCDSHTSGVGTATYAAPEQLVTDVYDAKVDMYSFGIVIYELWTPFSTGMERARQIKLLRNHRIPYDFTKKYPGLGKLVSSLLDHDPELRPSSTDLHKNDFFEKSKDRVIDDQMRIILSLEKEVDQLKIENRKLMALLQGSQPPTLQPHHSVHLTN